MRRTRLHVDRVWLIALLQHSCTACSSQVKDAEQHLDCPVLILDNLGVGRSPCDLCCVNATCSR